LTVATYDQTISDLEQQHASALQEKDTIILNMQQQINDNIEMIAEHENRKRLDDTFFVFYKWREIIMFSRLRKLQDALSVVVQVPPADAFDVQVPLAAAAVDTEVLSADAFHVLPDAAIDVQVPSNAAVADTEALSVDVVQVPPDDVVATETLDAVVVQVPLDASHPEALSSAAVQVHPGAVDATATAATAAPLLTPKHAAL